MDLLSEREKMQTKQKIDAKAFKQQKQKYDEERFRQEVYAKLNTENAGNYIIKELIDYGYYEFSIHRYKDNREALTIFKEQISTFKRRYKIEHPLYISIKNNDYISFDNPKNFTTTCEIKLKKQLLDGFKKV